MGYRKALADREHRPQVVHTRQSADQADYGLLSNEEESLVYSIDYIYGEVRANVIE